MLAQPGKFAETPQGFVPACHLRALGRLACTDPVAVAETFLGTPYLWGGNSRAGHRLFGAGAGRRCSPAACPAPATAICRKRWARKSPKARPLQRGDLLFWKGHVALVADAGRILHATGHFMATVYEDIDSAIARIAAQGQPVIARRRL